MSLINPLNPLVHHTLMIQEGQIDSELLDWALGLTWRNLPVDDLLVNAVTLGAYGAHAASRTLFNAALLKEDAINNGINLEDKL